MQFFGGMGTYPGGAPSFPGQAGAAGTQPDPGLALAAMWMLPWMQAAAQAATRPGPGMGPAPGWGKAPAWGAFPGMVRPPGCG